MFKLAEERLPQDLTPNARLEFGDRQPANAGQKFLFTCHPASGRQKTAGQPILRPSPKLQLILVHIYRLRLNKTREDLFSFTTEAMFVMFVNKTHMVQFRVIFGFRMNLD